MAHLKIVVRKNPLVTDFTVKVVNANETAQRYEQADFDRTAPGIYQLVLTDFEAGDYLPVSLTIYGGTAGGARPAASAEFTLATKVLAPRQTASISPGSNQATSSYAYPLKGAALQHPAV